MLSLIVSVYKNEESLLDLLAALQDMNGQLAGSLEVVLVVDGSPDRSYAILQERLLVTGLWAMLVLLTRNFGAFAAVRMGLELAAGDFFAVMAVDLQEPPKLALQMLALLEQDQADVVIAERAMRHDSWWQRWQS